VPLPGRGAGVQLSVFVMIYTECCGLTLELCRKLVYPLPTSQLIVVRLLSRCELRQPLGRRPLLGCLPR
jgi:hypothetical protein